MRAEQALAEQAAILDYLGPVATGAPVDEPIIRQIPREWLHLYWPKVLPQIERVAVRTKGRWTVEAIAGQFLKPDGWQMWIVWDGRIAAVVATAITIELSGMRTGTAVFVAGREMAAWRHLIADLEEWAREQGATNFDMMISKGIARHFPDYRMSHVLLEKEL